MIALKRNVCFGCRAKIYKGLNSLPTLFEAVTSEYAPNSLRQKQQRRMREQVFPDPHFTAIHTALSMLSLRSKT